MAACQSKSEGFGAAVRTLRTRLGLKQAEAATRSEGLVSEANWRRIEGGRQDGLRDLTLAGLDRALGLEPGEAARLFGDPTMDLAELRVRREPVSDSASLLARLVADMGAMRTDLAELRREMTEREQLGPQTRHP